MVLGDLPGACGDFLKHNCEESEESSKDYSKTEPRTRGHRHRQGIIFSDYRYENIKIIND